MNSLPDTLKEWGFRPVKTALPGFWASNEELSLQLKSQQRDPDRRRMHIARVYDAPADALELTRVERLADERSRDPVKATKLALEAAEEGGDEA